MGRHVGRSKGCRACLQRRIKCDEAQPECTQCVTKQRKCPGPTFGTVFIDMATKKKQIVPLQNKSPVESRNNASSQTRLYLEASSLPWNDKSCFEGSLISLPQRGSASEISMGARQQGSRGNNYTYQQYMLPSSFQPSKALPFQQLFVSQFITDFDARNVGQDPMRSWWRDLPVLLEASSHRAALCALRAMTMAYYGGLAEDVSIQTEARKWYHRGLRSQREALLQGVTLDIKAARPGIEDALSTAMFSIYELILETTPSAWLQHIQAGSNLLTLRGPEFCQRGLAHKLFRSIRTTIFSACFIMTQAHIFATEPWTTIPFALHPKMPNDYLVDIMFQIPGCLEQYNFLRNSAELDPKKRAMISSNLNSSARSMVDDLICWRQKYDETSDQQYETATISENHNAITRVCNRSISGCNNPSTSPLLIPEHAIHLIVHLILSYTADESEYHDSCVSFHANCILLAATCFRNNEGSVDGPFMRELIFPLETVRIFALDPLQIQSAEGLLKNWAVGFFQKGVTGEDCCNFAPGPVAMFLFLNID